jgi:hypothetical protein
MYMTMCESICECVWLSVNMIFFMSFWASIKNWVGHGLQSFLWLSERRNHWMGSGNTLLTSLCTCSSGSFTGWGVSAPWCPVGWCISGDVLCLATSWELTTDWRLNLGSPPCGPHSECWFLPHKGGTSFTIIQAPSPFLFPAQLPHLLRLWFMFPSTDTSTLLLFLYSFYRDILYSWPGPC